jgi:uncharacterized protein
MRAVLDTNIILASIARKSQFRIIIDKLYNQEYELVISNSVLLEYEEKLIDFFSEDTANNFINTLLVLPNVIQIEPLFFSRLLPDDDDNKFLDIYYSGKADFLVTDDRHFSILHKISLPEHHPLKILDFITILENQTL